MQYFTHYARKFLGRSKCRGIFALPLMIIIGGVIVEIAVAGGLLAFLFADSNLAIRSSAIAYNVAQAGIQDALLRLALDDSFTSPTSYQISVNAGSVTATASVTVTANGSQDVITATSTVMRRTKTIQEIVVINSLTGVINPVSILEQ